LKLQISCYSMINLIRTLLVRFGSKRILLLDFRGMDGVLEFNWCRSLKTWHLMNITFFNSDLYLLRFWNATLIIYHVSELQHQLHIAFQNCNIFKLCSFIKTFSTMLIYQIILLSMLIAQCTPCFCKNKVSWAKREGWKWLNFLFFQVKILPGQI